MGEDEFWAKMRRNDADPGRAFADERDGEEEGDDDDVRFEKDDEEDDLGMTTTT